VDRQLNVQPLGGPLWGCPWRGPDTTASSTKQQQKGRRLCTRRYGANVRTGDGPHRPAHACRSSTWKRRPPGARRFRHLATRAGAPLPTGRAAAARSSWRRGDALRAALLYCIRRLSVRGRQPPMWAPRRMGPGRVAGCTSRASWSWEGEKPGPSTPPKAS